ncbi:MAG: lytic transglycosylase domain-containing protein [Ruminococcus sp.]|nr:lytic transglycosylase domain-containing protein [Ruminococcus sp.]
MPAKTSKTVRKTSAPRGKGAVKRKTKKRIKKGPVFLAVVLLAAIVTLIVLHGKDIAKKVKELPQAFTYPTDYEEYVVKYSSEYNCDPVLVFSVIKVESGFDPDAVSEVGARGLMQLMKDAFDWIKFRLDDDRGYTFDDIFDPKLNIQYGTYYLSYLLEKYDGSIELTAASYHCGMSLVDSWIADGTIDPKNFRIEDIPDANDQTANYVDKIMTAYSHYKDILASSHTVSE